jgi:hypothetical protein
MVWLGGPRRRGRSVGPSGIYLHDPPPGYRRPRLRMPLKERQRQAREERALMRVTGLVLVLTAVAVVVLVVLLIALHA